MLPAVSDLFKRALAPYQKHPKLMSGFILLMFLPIFFLGTAKFSIDLMKLVYGPFALHAAFWIIGSIIVSLLSLWFNLGFILALTDMDRGQMPEKIKVYLKKTKNFVLPAFGLTFLLGLIVLGGFILIIVPGIIFSIWFVFILQARIIDQKKGFNSFTYSKSLVSGNWWGVFFRISLGIFSIYVLMSVFGGILNGLFKVDLNLLTLQKLTILSFTVTVLTTLVQAILTPFATAIPTILYLDLKKSKPASIDSPETIKK